MYRLKAKCGIERTQGPELHLYRTGLAFVNPTADSPLLCLSNNAWQAGVLEDATWTWLFVSLWPAAASPATPG